jgi:RNA-directed DNA polymerase
MVEYPKQVRVIYNIVMKTYKNLYPKLCSYSNLEKAFYKAKKNKSKKFYVKEFEKNLQKNLLELKKDLETLKYRPEPLTKFTIQDPKTRVIRKSIFKDRVVHHVVINILEPIFDKTFIFDSYANRLRKGTTTALTRYDYFKRKISKNGTKIKNAFDNNSIKGYVLKADIRHFFDSVDQKILLDIIAKKIRDDKVLWLINIILKNFDNNKKGMPLGNMTSQFFANLYLNNFDQFVKKRLRMKYYLRYVDDFVILHKDKMVLEDCKDKISRYMMNLRLDLHPEKSKIYPLYKGINLLGFKVFYHYRLVRKRNVKIFLNRLNEFEKEYKDGYLSRNILLEKLQGWFAYSNWGNSYKLRKNLVNTIACKFEFKDEEELNKLRKVARTTTKD